MKTLIFLAVFMAQIAGAVAEDDHLVPERSIFSERERDRYYELVVSVFDDAFDYSIFGRVIVLPSFHNEYAIALSLEDETYKIIYLASDTYLWGFELLREYKAGEIISYDEDGHSTTAEDIAELEAAVPPSIDDVVVERCELQIDDALGSALYTLWSEMLFRTRYVDRRPVTPAGDELITIGADGVTYHFSFDHGIDVLTGRIWSPDEASITGRFVAITGAMKEACTTQNTALLSRMGGNVDQLLSDLAGSQY